MSWSPKKKVLPRCKEGLRTEAIPPPPSPPPPPPPATAKEVDEDEDEVGKEEPEAKADPQVLGVEADSCCPLYLFTLSANTRLDNNICKGLASCKPMKRIP